LFRTSLSNLLIEMGDLDAADEIYTKLQSHPLAHTKHIGLSTRFISDITKNKYSPHFTWFFYNGDLENSTLQSFGEKEGSQILKIIEEEVNADRLNLKFKKNGSIEGVFPNLFLVSGLENYSHWIVGREDEYFINDGKLVKYPIDSVSVNGLLHLN